MLSFITFKDASEQLEIVADGQGIEELINYLQEVKSLKGHIHLTIDSELNKFPISGNRIGKTLCAKQVRIEYAESEEWYR